LGTAVPEPSVTVAVITLGCPAVTDVCDAAIAIVTPVAEVEVKSALFPQALRQQSRVKQISSNNIRRNLAWIVFTILLSFFRGIDDNNIMLNFYQKYY
jgi:hypothetical protein